MFTFFIRNASSSLTAQFSRSRNVTYHITSRYHASLRCCAYTYRDQHAQMRPPSTTHISSDQLSPRTNGNSPAGVIPVEEDIRRLFQECRIGHGNETLLNEALAFASPSDLKEKDIIKVRLACFTRISLLSS